MIGAAFEKQAARRAKKNVAFFEPYMGGEDIKVGWGNESDFKKYFV